MLGLIRDMLRTPEAQADGYSWSATFGGHASVALGPWGIIAIVLDMWTAAWLTPLLYFVFWEGMQWALSPRRTCPLLWDGILDTVAVAFGCYAAALLGHDHQFAAVMCWGASIGVMATGCRVRE
ncbi:hypothetical protein [Paracoccus beibuensis]|uniref:hypothetical protein n=1 Tax=Paracoccus beibuensis TaxID=547602 RepID=UPI00223F79A1|nr:hypothetical protein [Paracoccus beibuensis]